MKKILLNTVFFIAILAPTLTNAINYEQLLELRVHYSKAVQATHPQKTLMTCFTTTDVLDSNHCVSLHSFIYTIRNHYDHGAKNVKFFIYYHAPRGQHPYRLVYLDECADMLNNPHRTRDENGKMLYSVSVDYMNGQLIYSNCHKTWLPS